MTKQLYRDTIHGFQAEASSRTMAWQLIRNKCHEENIEVPTMDKVVAVAPPVQPSPGKQEGGGKEFKQLLKIFVTNFALMIQEGQNIRKEYEHYEKGNAISIEKLMLLALPSQPSEGYTKQQMKDMWEASYAWHFGHVNETNPAPDMETYLKSLPSAPAEGYSRKFVEGFLNWFDDGDYVKDSDNPGKYRVLGTMEPLFTTADLLQTYLQSL